MLVEGAAGERQFSDQAVRAPATAALRRRVFPTPDPAIGKDQAHIHARIERWALDEVALPGKLVNQIVQWLYREDRFCHGILKVLGSTVGPTRMPIPTLAIINAADEIAQLTSVAPFIGKMPTNDTRIIEHPGEIGVGLPHVGISSGVLPTHRYGRKSSPGLKRAVESGDSPQRDGVGRIACSSPAVPVTTPPPSTSMRGLMTLLCLPSARACAVASATSSGLRRDRIGSSGGITCHWGRGGRDWQSAAASPNVMW
jgi:polyhydroxyalkanoate synthase